MREQLDSIGLAVGKTASIGGGSVAVVAGMSAETFAAIAGAIAAVIGLGIQWYFNARRDKRQVEEHAVRMERLKQGLDVPTDG